jgi:NHLM bacteriocin system ABC transporter ATP-binding protein
MAEESTRGRASGAPHGLKIRELAGEGATRSIQELVFSEDSCEKVVLGRSPKCDVVVADPSVSRYHAEIVRTPDGFLLVDLDSANGVWVDDRRVKEYRLGDQQRFALGAVVFELLLIPGDTDNDRKGLLSSEGEEQRTLQQETMRSSSGREVEQVVATEEVMCQPPEHPRSCIGVTDVLCREGELVHAAGNQPILLDGSDAVWFVQTGKLELFTVGVEEGRPSGARTHFMTILSGQLMFGMDLEGFGIGSGFVAVGKIGTELRRLRVSRLQELAGDRRYTTQIASLVDAWVTGLSQSLTREIVPGPRVEVILTGDEEEVELENQQRASANHGVLWLDVVHGNLLFVGMEELLFRKEQARERDEHPSMEVSFRHLLADVWRGEKGPPLFPITTETWIEASNTADLTTSLHVFSSDSMVSDPALWRGLEVFHEILCHCEFINKRLAAVDELNRLKSKAEYSEAARKAACREIVQVMEELTPGRAAYDLTEVEEPIFAACCLVGLAMGTQMKAGPDRGRPASFNDRVAAIAMASQCRSRLVALRGDWWRHDQGPFIARIEGSDTPVALLPKGATTYEMVDPTDGGRRLVDEHVADELEPFAHVLYRPFPDGPLNAWHLVRFGSQGLASDLWMLLVMGVSLGLLGALTPVVTGRLFDTAIPQADRGLLLQYTTALFVAALLMAAFKITRNIAVLRLQGKIDYSTQAALWDRLLNLPSTFFRGYTAGDLATRAAGIGDIRSLVAGAGSSAILGALSSVFYVVLMFYYSISLAMLAVGLTAVFIGFTSAADYVQLRYHRDQLLLHGRISGLVLQLISGVAKLRVSGAENHALHVWAKDFAAQRRAQLKIGRLQNTIAVFTSGFPVFSSMAVFLVLATVQEAATARGMPPLLTTGEFIAFTAAFTAFLFAMQALGDASLSLLRVVPIYERLKPIVTTPAEIDESKAYPGILKGGIELSHIHFRYHDEGPWILEDANLKILPGELVALVGPSGCGKSTMMRLMLGFETPQKGTVYYDGQDLKSLDLREVRQQLGVVLQGSQLLPESVYRNIVGSMDLSIDDAWEAVRLVGLAQDIEEMPMGMHTFVSEGGGNFSGGQQQRLMIARALVRRPRIIFLDEATSALDNRSQEIVTESMEQLQATRLVIAHRLSTIRNADRICYMEKGRIAEMGTFDELMELGGRFWKLARRQMA